MHFVGKCERDFWEEYAASQLSRKSARNVGHIPWNETSFIDYSNRWNRVPLSP